MALSERRRRLVRRLRSRKTRARASAVLVEGARAVGEALAAGCMPSFAVVTESAADTDVAGSLRSALSADDFVTTGARAFSELSDTESPAGVLAVFPEPETSLVELRASRVLVLDAVQDPGNVGTLVRSAVAFGLDTVVCLDGTGDPWGPKAVRSSAGTVFHLPVVTTDAASALRWLSGLGVPLLVAAPDGVEPADFRGRGGFALVVGNEGAGVRDSVRAVAAGSVAVPMSGPVESLNAGVAGSILMRELTAEESS